MYRSTMIVMSARTLLKLPIWRNRTASAVICVKNFSSTASCHKEASLRSDLKDAKRILVKVGSAVLTREDQCGMALGRLASIVEQVSVLQNEGRQMIMVSSGAVAFGLQKLRQEIIMSMSMRQTLSPSNDAGLGMNKSGKSFIHIQPRACGAVGQSGLMSLYEAMFMQYGVRTAQVLITKPDVQHEESRKNLRSTLNELLRLNIIPILNGNDAVEPPDEPDKDTDMGEILTSVKDNDSLASRLAVEMEVDLMVLMTNVNGIYTQPPGAEGTRLLSTYTPSVDSKNVVFGRKSKVGMGGMESKVHSATYALERGVSCVVCNGMEENVLTNIVIGKKIGTFFTHMEPTGTPVEIQAMQAREGGRILQSLAPGQRAAIIEKLSNLLIERREEIIAANRIDLDTASEQGLALPLVDRLVLDEDKLRTLSDGLKQIADSALHTLGQVLKRTQIADGMELRQVTVPIGVLMVIFESRPDALPQVAALAISSGNGLLLKGGKEASFTNKILHQLVQEALDPYVPKETISLVSRKEDIQDLLQLSQYIDLVIPRGSSELIARIQHQSKGIPVLGHSEGICHVYLDKHVNPEMAIKIVRDSKCDYPAACNSMETLLLHKSHLRTPLFDGMYDMLKKENVKIHAGPRLSSLLKFGPAPASSMRKEYSGLQMALEVVDDVEEAILHINKYGSSHTDAIITEDGSTAERFLQMVDSACVFHNSSTRFADGYRFGLGAEVGISTTRIHARGPVGVEGLLTTKWILHGNGQTVQDFADGNSKYIHQHLSLDINSSNNEMEAHN